jgi:hypothetical protein
MQRHLHTYLPDDLKHLSEKKRSRYEHSPVAHNSQFYCESEDDTSNDGESDDSSSTSSNSETFVTIDETNIKLSGRFTYNIHIDRHRRRDVDHKWHIALINGVSYKAQPNWHGREWYDWAVVKFPKTKALKERRVQSGDKIQCIGRIITFFRHLFLHRTTRFQLG